MKKIRRVWIFAVVFAIAAVQGTIFAESPETESSVEAVTETTETGKARDTIILMERAKEQLCLPGEAEKIPALKSNKKQSKQVQETVKKTAGGQTLLDVKQGNIRITRTGATGGGISSETSLNPKGYRITGTTTSNNIKVEPGVTTDITLDNVSVTSDSGSKNCMDVSHADVTVTLVGKNVLSCGITGYGALVKDGMDDSKLIIQCEHTGEKGHRCAEGSCGSLEAKGTVSHATAIGNITTNRTIAEESGFSNLTIKGGIIEAKAGGHNCAIGAACGSYTDAEKYAKNIRISGGVVTAEGGAYCAGIGGGNSTPVDGIYITGGTVYASGGSNSPGIGSGGDDKWSGAKPEHYAVSNIIVSGGDTLVRAVGHKVSNMPGIGCGKSNLGVVGEAKNVAAVPDTGYQGYIQDGTSEIEYNFTDESPFQEKQSIKVDKYFTVVYFGPFRDENKINPETKEQLGANHLISQTGGKGFTEEQIKELTKANGKDKDGNSFELEDFLLPDKGQINAINEAKKKGEIGDYPLTISTENETQVTIIVSLRGNGTDATSPDSKNGLVGANDLERETGGKAFGEEEIKELCGIKGKDKDGNNLKLEDFKIDEEQLKSINEAKTSKNTGKFPLTYETPDGETVTVEVLLTGTVEISFDTHGGSQAPEMQSIDSGKKAQKPENPVKEGYMFEGWYYTDEDGSEAEWKFEDPVYENMTLKARWKKESKTEATKETGNTVHTAQNTTENKTSAAEKVTTEKQIPDWEYSKREKTERTTVKTVKTGDETASMFFLIILGFSLIGIELIYKEMR